MHIIFFIFVGLPLIVLIFWVLVGIPFQFVMEGAANNMPGMVLGGLIWALVVWGGLFAVLGR